MQHAVTKLHLADQVVRPLTLIELWGVEIRADVLSVRDLHPVSLGRVAGPPRVECSGLTLGGAPPSAESNP